MSITTKSVRLTVFSGKKTTSGEQKRLMDARFIHVTGLPEINAGHVSIIGEKLKDEECGKWNAHGSFQMIITVGGEIWLRTRSVPCTNLASLLEEFCPKGVGGFVPCTSGGTIDMHDLMERDADPSFGLTYSDQQ